jgi:hypothetical protein
MLSIRRNPPIRIMPRFKIVLALRLSSLITSESNPLSSFRFLIKKSGLNVSKRKRTIRKAAIAIGQKDGSQSPFDPLEK